MSAKVIPLNGGHSAPRLLLDIDDLDGYRGVKIVAGLIQQWQLADKSRRLSHLARRANLTVGTISRIRDRETLSPRLHTILMILKALGFSVVRFE